MVTKEKRKIVIYQTIMKIYELHSKIQIIYEISFCRFVVPFSTKYFGKKIFGKKMLAVKISRHANSIEHSPFDDHQSFYEEKR